MPTKKLLAATAMAASLIGGGVAGAALFTPVLSGAQETTDDTTTEDTTTDDSDDTSDKRGGWIRHGPLGRAGHLGHIDLEVAAEVLGVTEDELRDALEDGDSIADVAEAGGVDLQTVIDALVANATERIDERVAELKENLPERVTDLVNGELRFDGPGVRFALRAGHRAIALDVAADALGVTDAELRDALEDGDSIADVAEAGGVDLQTVIDALVANATERIDEAVADGDLDADDAAELKEDVPDRISALVERDFPFFGGPGHHRFGRGR